MLTSGWPYGNAMNLEDLGVEPAFKTVLNDSSPLVFTSFCSLLPHWKRLTCITNRIL